IFPDHMSRWAFLALTFGTCLIAAAGNIINDRFDTVADAVNRPGKNIVGKLVSVKTAEYSYYILSTIGSLP
ncbi:MAG: prenyltransferase, partial [Bacteroidota bacterium]